MIRSVIVVALVGLPALGEPVSRDAGVEPAGDTTIERYRTPLEALTERMLGSASRAVRFDWRKKTAAFGVLTSELLELNNFSSLRVGAFGRMPLGDLMAEVAFSRVFVWGSESTEKLALTPYRQSGRPNRFELDINFGYPLAEGVVTPRFAFLPAAELVFSVNVGFRYLFYADALKGASAGEVAGAIFAPKLTQKELANMAPLRLPGMQLDDARYDLLAGISLDMYFQPGLFLSPRVLLALPIFAGLSGPGVKWWWELTLSLGWML